MHRRLVVIAATVAALVACGVVGLLAWNQYQLSSFESECRASRGRIVVQGVKRFCALPNREPVEIPGVNPPNLQPHPVVPKPGR